MKVLHVLETSVPHNVGYTIRASAIVGQQRKQGLAPVVVTSPLFQTATPEIEIEVIEGVRYYRTNRIAAPGSARTKLGSYAVRALMMGRYRRAVTAIARREQPDVIHAHSSYNNALAARAAATELGIPMLYEVRTLWGEAAVIEDGLRSNSWKHRLLWRFELRAMRGADLVVPIATGIRDELVRRGIPADRMVIVPNGVDTSRFPPMLRDAERARSVGLGGLFNLGFVGSLRKLEGLSTLLDAVAICQAQGAAVGVLIVGEGPDRSALQAKATSLQLKHVVFTGNVPHADVNAWYSIIDIVVYPRIPAVINERVTPLKPLEVMSMGKVCVGSDVGGLKELISDDNTGLIFRSGDASDLARIILSLMDDRSRMDRLGRAGSAFVHAEREWSKIIDTYTGLYAGLKEKNVSTIERSAGAPRSVDAG